MDPIHFAYWLKGYAEIHGAPPSAAQWQIINDHLDLVFNKVTPDRQPHGAPLSGRAPSTDWISGLTVYPPITGLGGSLDMSWYPESLREYNRLHPEAPLYC